MQGGDAAYAFVYFEDHEAAARAKKYLVDSFPILKVGFYMKNSLFEINAVPPSPILFSSPHLSSSYNKEIWY